MIVAWGLLVNIEYAWTDDDLRLMGVHYAGKKTCVVVVHGMSGSIIENYFAVVLGEKLVSQGIGLLYGHNRGYGYQSVMPKRPTAEDNGWHHERHGTMYELFEESPRDIDAWVKRARALGYERIVLMGHSLGCSKVVYYISQHPDVDFAGVILASPPDVVGLAEMATRQPDHLELLGRARELLQLGRPYELVGGGGRNMYALSAQTYASMFERDGAADNLPVRRNPERFEQLASITWPMLVTLGNRDDIIIRSAEEDVALIRAKATSAPACTTKIIDGANHNYENREHDFSEVVSAWVERLLA